MFRKPSFCSEVTNHWGLDHELPFACLSYTALAKALPYGARPSIASSFTGIALHNPPCVVCGLFDTVQNEGKGHSRLLKLLCGQRKLLQLSWVLRQDGIVLTELNFVVSFDSALLFMEKAVCLGQPLTFKYTCCCNTKAQLACIRLVQ